jgi:enoyl-CoA hydratase/carnithine racemase
MKHYIVSAIESLGVHCCGFLILECNSTDNKRVYLITVEINGKRGVVLHYENPPVHEIGSETLDGYSMALTHIEEIKDKLSFLIFSFAPDAIHAGGDLKETLKNLEDQKGHYDWADKRLNKAFHLYKRVRALSKNMRTVSILAGGNYYGGSAEIALWADYMVCDSRASIHFTEALIGLIAGWCGIARLITKIGFLNARFVVESAQKISARELEKIWAVDKVVDVLCLPFPKKSSSSQVIYSHARDTFLLLLPTVIQLACTDKTTKRGTSRKMLFGEYEKARAPQSVEALSKLFAMYDSDHFDEERFAFIERDLDAQLYRDPNLADNIRSIIKKKSIRENRQ